MGYSHFTNLAATARPGVTKAQLITALAPIADYLGWTDEELDTGFDDMSSGSLQWYHDSESGELSFELHTEGEVGHSFFDLVGTVAANLHDLVLPTHFRHVDGDCPNPEDASAKIWIGSGQELKLAQREDVILQINALLGDTISDPEWCNAIVEQIRQAPLPPDSNDQAAPSPSAPSF